MKHPTIFAPSSPSVRDLTARLHSFILLLLSFLWLCSTVPTAAFWNPSAFSGCKILQKFSHLNSFVGTNNVGSRTTNSRSRPGRARRHPIDFPACLAMTKTPGNKPSMTEEQPATTVDTTSTATTTSKSRSTGPVWCPEQQIYVGGIIPGATNEDVKAMLEQNKGCLRVFGYGSLCWNPGKGALGHASVTSKLGHARGYRRAWAQKSTDHRGYPTFPGIVCTLLQESEVQAILVEQQHYYDHNNATSSHSNSLLEEDLTKHTIMTEGMIYLVPPALAQECLAELDFREKGGYAREIITVIEDETNTPVQALLYRGTPENPAFWPRILWDLPLAAAIMAVSIGPSGPNDVYLNQLDDFLQQTPSSSAEFIRHDDTCALANMTHALQQHALYFFHVSGSNQHGQILWGNPYYRRDYDIPQLTESVLCCHSGIDDEGVSKSATTIDPPQQLLAGGGHSGLLTQHGKLYLWGWNDQGQCGYDQGETVSSDHATTTNSSENNNNALPVLHPLPNIHVETAAVGFSHTLVIEHGSGKLFAFGDNSHGQVTGPTNVDHDGDGPLGTTNPITPDFIQDVSFCAVSAGLFHSAAITTAGELFTFGSAKHGQSLGTPNANGVSQGRWSPPDGSKLVDVVCGRHHTAVVDDKGRIWSFGDNKYGQLGRSVVFEETGNTSIASKKKKAQTFDPVPRLVDGPLGKDHSITNHEVKLRSGWSHMVALVHAPSSIDTGEESTTSIYGWGRSDKGQLASKDKIVPIPRRLESPFLRHVQDVSCGSESTYFLDKSTKNIYSCGWNEHGNLAIGRTSSGNKDMHDWEEDVYDIRQVIDTGRIVSPPTYNSGNRSLLMAAGGAHFLVLMT